MKKFICLGILVLMTVVCVVPAYAANGTTNVGAQGVIAPQWTYISFIKSGVIDQLVGKSHLYGACFSLR
jgi:hypothetical protein